MVMSSDYHNDDSAKNVKLMCITESQYEFSSLFCSLIGFELQMTSM